MEDILVKVTIKGKAVTVTIDNIWRWPGSTHSVMIDKFYYGVAIFKEDKWVLLLQNDQSMHQTLKSKIIQVMSEHRPQG